MTEQEYLEAFWAIILEAYNPWEVGRLQREADQLASLY